MSIKELIHFIKSDISTHGGKSFVKILTVWFFSPSFRLMLNYRLGKYMHESSIKLFRFTTHYLRYKQVTKRCCLISFKAKIGKNVKFQHPIGVVIGDGVEIMDNVRIWQQVTLGSHGKKGEPLQYPVIKSGVKIFAGAKIIGGVCINENSVIGANAVVNIDVPANSIAVGIPAKIIQK
jgi:serine O-acetyltransferase